MSKSFISIILVIMFSLLSIQKIHGQDITFKMRQEMARADSEYAARSNDEKKLDEGVYQLLRMTEASDTSAEMLQKLNKLFNLKGAPKRDSKGRVEINIGIRPRSAVPSVISLIKSLDGVITFAPPNFGDVGCRIQLKYLRKLINQPGIVSIDLALPGEMITN